MKFRQIIIDSNRQELTEHGTPDFPMSMDEQNVEHFQGIQTSHWHKEIQINLVTEGCVKIETVKGNYILHEGEGLFINSGVLHAPSQIDTKKGIYICVNFLPELIFGQFDSTIRKYYVDPILIDDSLKVILFNNEEWHQQILALLTSLASINRNPYFGYELDEKNILSEIWSILLKNNQDSARNNIQISFTDKQRIGYIKKYISMNYMDHITLENLASNGFISKSECCRLFQRVENTTPIRYLNKYRIMQSTKFLSSTNLNVAEIAIQTGFSNSNYFAQVFRDIMGCTPLEYRKSQRLSAR